MPFAVPTFNVAINVWYSGVVDPIVVPPVGPPNLPLLMANVSLGRRSLTGTDSFATQGLFAGTGVDVLLRIGMVPAGTDIRGPYQGDTSIVEVPAGSAAYYKVFDVADMAKGFANEHRLFWFAPFNPAIIPFYALPRPLP